MFNIVIAAPGVDLGELGPLYFDVCLVLEPFYAHRCIDLHQRDVDAPRDIVLGSAPEGPSAPIEADDYRSEEAGEGS